MYICKYYTLVTRVFAPSRITNVKFQKNKEGTFLGAGSDTRACLYLLSLAIEERNIGCQEASTTPQWRRYEEVHIHFGSRVPFQANYMLCSRET